MLICNWCVSTFLNGSSASDHPQGLFERSSATVCTLWGQRTYIYTYIYIYIYYTYIYISYISIYHHLSIMYKVGRKCRSFKALRKQVRWSSKMRVPSCNYQPTSQRGLFLDERLVNSGSIFHQARLQLDFNLCHL